MKTRNSLLYGFFIGLFIPVAAFFVFYLFFELISKSGNTENPGILSEDFRERTAAIAAIALNAIPMNQAYKKRLTQTMRGILIPTFILVVVWLIVFGKSVL